MAEGDEKTFFSLADIRRVLGDSAAQAVASAPAVRPLPLLSPLPTALPSLAKPVSGAPLRLLVLTASSHPVLEALQEKAKETSGGVVVFVGSSAEEVKEGWEGEGDAAALLWFTGAKVLEGLLQNVKNLKWVHSPSAGVNHVMCPALQQSDVVLTNARGAFSASLGEWGVFAAMYFAKRLPAMLKAHEEGRWDKLMVEEVQGKTFGVVGYGDIGRHGALRAKLLGMRVLAVRRRNIPDPEGLVDHMYAMEELNTMLGLCDFVFCALPLTPATHHLIGKQQLEAMQPHAVLINVGRGATVDEAALVAALQQGTIKGAALDVFTEEPLPEGHALYGMRDRVLLSAHCADNTPNYHAFTMAMFARNLVRFAKGEPLENVVDKEAGY